MTIRVGVLDDHRAFGDAISVALSAYDEIAVVAVVNSIDCMIEAARVEGPDVLLIDYQLLDGTGIDCASRLAEVGIEARLILLTAHASDDVTARALAAGFERVLSKDVQLQDVANAVRTPTAEMLPRRIECRASFSKRQREVLELMGQGLDPASIADELYISIHTARSHVKDVLKALGASTQLSAVTTAIREGYLLPPSLHRPQAARTGR